MKNSSHEMRVAVVKNEGAGVNGVEWRVVDRGGGGS